MHVTSLNDHNLSSSLRLLTFEYQLESPCEVDGICYRITDAHFKRKSPLVPNYVLAFHRDLRVHDRTQASFLESAIEVVVAWNRPPWCASRIWT